MKLPADIIINDDKLTRYLLVPRMWDDKSKFLAMAGFSPDKPEALKTALLHLANIGETMEDSVNEYGLFFRTDGLLTGPNGRQLPVTVIWLRWQTDGHIRFVTLKPRREMSR